MQNNIKKTNIYMFENKSTSSGSCKLKYNSTSSLIELIPIHIAWLHMVNKQKEDNRKMSVECCTMITSSVLLGLEVVLEEIALLLVLLSLMLTFSYFTGDVFIVERLFNFRVSTSIYGLPLLLYVLWS